MYEAFMQNSDFVKANLIMREDAKGRLEGYHEMLNGRNMVFQVAQMLYKNDSPELRVYPVRENVIRRLKMEPDELRELAITNLKRFSIMHKEMELKVPEKERRAYVRRK